MNQRYLVVGAGFSGAVLARELVTHLDAKVLVIDERPHIGGNCFTERDPATGVMVHRYGPHIFHTSNEAVWQYVCRFGEFVPFVNRVKASVRRGIFSLPINLATINQFYGRRFNPQQARAFVESIADKNVGEPANFEEQALKFLGRELYETFFYGYTRKQWGCDPRELPASILKRLPIRFNYNDSYYESRHQGIPRDGYTALIKRILEHPDIEIQLARRFEPVMADEFVHCFYCGSLDAYFGHRLGRLGYRTVYWDRHEENGDFQGNAVINYTEMTEPHTRIHEHKHFAPWEEHSRTVAFVEFSKETAGSDIPYYPKRLAADEALFNEYAALAANETKTVFLGRLATYRYLDMHMVIAEALAVAQRFIQWRAGTSAVRPVFSAP
jgi:UDP-galactopyranose mutase